MDKKFLTGKGNYQNCWYDEFGSNNYEGIRPVVNVRMSPQFAKEFTQLLAGNVKLFEGMFGEIKIYKPESN